MVVPPDQRAGGPVQAVLTVTNISKADHRIWAFGYLPERFGLWLIRDGRQVALTDAGRRKERLSGILDSGDGPCGDMRPGETRSARVDVASLFQIDAPGAYTLVAEHWPQGSGANLAAGAADQFRVAALANFVIEPHQ